jgi:hypothetical protein
MITTRRDIWRLKEKVGKHGKLDPKQFQTSLEPIFMKRFNSVSKSLGCKDAKPCG